jgi:tetratricopeptide (TPR) repeat protein
MREVADALLQIDPQNLLALVTRAMALDEARAEDAENAGRAADVLAQAVELDATHPRVVYARVRWALRDASDKAQAAHVRGRADEASQIMAAARQETAEMLRAALAANAQATQVRSLLGRVLLADEETDTVRELLEQGARENPTDPDALLEWASFLSRRAAEAVESGAGDVEQAKADVAAALENLAKLLAVDPAYYIAYGARAEAQILQARLAGVWDSPARLTRQKEILDGILDGLASTVSLRTVRAVVSRDRRIATLVLGFQHAMRFYRENDEAERAAALEYARRFMSNVMTEAPESPYVPLMKGDLAMVEGDEVAAIQAFQRSEEKLTAIPGAETYVRLAREQLARLYTQAQEFGVALRYTDQAMQMYVNAGAKPQAWLVVLKASLLNRLDRAQDALDLLDANEGGYADSAQWQAARGEALARLGRGGEAIETLGAGGQDGRVKVNQARFAAANGDYAVAEGLLREALATDPSDNAALRLLVQVMAGAGRQDAALEYLQALAATSSDAGQKRLIDAFMVSLSTTDAEQRDAKLFAIIEQIPDSIERATESMRFWAMRGDYQRAAGYLDEMARLQPDDASTLGTQFEFALQLQQFDKAEGLLRKLAPLNVDHADGRRLRGQLHMARGEIEQALSEFRAAERVLQTDSLLKVQIAQALMRLPEPQVDEAVETLQSALTLNPLSFEANKLLYMVFEESGRRQEGIRYLEAAAKMNPRDPYIAKRNELLEEERDPSVGIKRREQKRQENPYDFENLLRLSELYSRNDQAPQAEEALLAAAELEPTSRAVANWGARLYAGANDREGGEKFLRSYIDAAQGAQRIPAVLLLARFLNRSGASDDALAAIQEADGLVDPLTDVDPARKRRLKLAGAVELAEHYAAVQQDAEMVAAYRRAQAFAEPGDDKVDVQIRVKILRGLLNLRSYGDFQAEVDKYLTDHPKEVNGLKLKAEYLLIQNDLPAARELLSAILEETPDDAWSLFMRGRVNIEMQRYADARNDLLRAKSARPDGFNFAHRAELARLYEIEGATHLAEAELREMFRDTGGDRKVALSLMQLFRNSSQLDKAKQFVNEMATREPEEAYWPYQLGKLLLDQKEYSAAVAPLAESVRLTKSENRGVLADWLEALTRANRAREAAEAFQALDPKLAAPQIRAQAAAAFLKLGRREDAAQEYGRAMLEGAATSLDLLNFVARQSFDALGDADTFQLIRRAITIVEQKSAPEIKARLQTAAASILLQTEKPEQIAVAEPILQSLMQENDSASRIGGEARLIYARIHELADRYEDAVRMYEEIVDAHPFLVTALNNLAYILADRLERPAEALPYAERARQAAPDNANVLDTVGHVYMVNGKLDQAEGTLIEALRIDPALLAARFHLGEVLAKQGRPRDARRALERVLEDAARQGNAEYQRKAREALDGLP